MGSTSWTVAPAPLDSNSEPSESSSTRFSWVCAGVFLNVASPRSTSTNPSSKTRPYNVRHVPNSEHRPIDRCIATEFRSSASRTGGSSAEREVGRREDVTVLPAATAAAGRSVMAHEDRGLGRPCSRSGSSNTWRTSIPSTARRRPARGDVAYPDVAAVGGPRDGSVRRTRPDALGAPSTVANARHHHFVVHDHRNRFFVGGNARGGEGTSRRSETELGVTVHCLVDHEVVTLQRHECWTAMTGLQSTKLALERRQPGSANSDSATVASDAAPGSRSYASTARSVPTTGSSRPLRLPGSGAPPSRARSPPGRPARVRPRHPASPVPRRRPHARRRRRPARPHSVDLGLRLGRGCGISAILGSTRLPNAISPLMIATTRNTEVATSAVAVSAVAVAVVARPPPRPPGFARERQLSPVSLDGERSRALSATSNRPPRGGRRRRSRHRAIARSPR